MYIRYRQSSGGRYLPFTCITDVHVLGIKTIANTRCTREGYNSFRLSIHHKINNNEALWDNRVHAESCLTGCPNTTNINRKYNPSPTSSKLSRLLKVIVCEATVRLRHLYNMTTKIICSTTKQKSKPFLLGLAIKLGVGKYRLTCLLIVFKDAFLPSKTSGRQNQTWHY